MDLVPHKNCGWNYTEVTLRCVLPMLPHRSNGRALAYAGLPRVLTM